MSTDDISMSPLEFVAFICKLTQMEVDKAQKEGRLPYDIFAFEEGRTGYEREEKAQKGAGEKEDCRARIPRVQVGACCQSSQNPVTG
jgi:hypothetical protein